VHAEGADAGRALGEIELLLERKFDEE